MRILTTAQAATLDKIAMVDHGIPETVLMAAAGKALAKEAKKMLTGLHESKIAIICGKGNNGGDGFAAAVELQEYNVALFALAAEKDIKGAAQHFHDKCIAIGLAVQYTPLLPEATQFQLIIDAILGTGAEGDLLDPIARWTSWISTQTCPVLAVDCPTGLNSNSGYAADLAVHAHITVTMGYSKLGLHLKQGPELAGKIKVADIGFPDIIDQLQGWCWSTVEKANIASYLTEVKADTHKYRQGKVLIIAGSRGMTGAAVLSTYGALRSGAGLTITAAPESIADIYEQTIIEGMTLNCPDAGTGYFVEDSFDTVAEKLDWCDALVIGPGLGQVGPTLNFVRRVVTACQKPMVIDADALRIFTADTGLFSHINAPFILTPHEGEFCRMLQIESWELSTGFPKKIVDFMSTCPGVLVLKNAPTITYYQQAAVINTTGNPGMATAGMGDVLAGMLGTLSAQITSPFIVSQIGVYLHGLVADSLTAKQGLRGLIASDLLAELPRTIQPFE